MAQFKIYGRVEHLRARHQHISDVLHGAAVRALQLPHDKRFHRFVPLEPWQLVAPKDRSENYLIIEAIMFTGRSVTVRKALVRAVMDDFALHLGLASADVEVTLIESPRENWGIRGQHGDEMTLPYKVEL
jgi:phenylpyruvate tautomerase PptA (4-oxalocrotonate tautomerase family)